MKKDFSITKKPASLTEPLPEQAPEKEGLLVLPIETVRNPQPKTVRKTVELPEDYFWKVKQTALNRRMKEKEVWLEILQEYFTDHPA